MVRTNDFDLCVVGGGLAGLVAAVRAAERGARPVVLEQGEEEFYACNSRYSGGIMHLAFLDVASPPEELAPKLRGKCPPDLDLDLVETIGANARRTLLWLQAVGARFVRAGPEPWQKWCLAPPRPRRSGLVWLGRGSDALLRALETELRRRGGVLWRGAKATGLAREGDGWLQVRFTRAGIDGVIAAPSVILADGGFQGDAALVKSFLTPAPERVLQRNSGSAHGFAFSAAALLGADVSSEHRFYGHVVSADSQANPKLWPWPTLDELAMAGLTVDRRGARLGEAAAHGVELANILARRADDGDAFVVFDDAVWRTIGPRTRVVPCNPMLEQLGGTVFMGETIRAVALAAGVTPDGLEETVARHNSSEERSRPGRQGGPVRIPPFRAVPAIAGLTYTMSGISVRPDTTVRMATGPRLPGLFAAGACVGGAEGGSRTFYMGGLAKAAILGLIAGEAAARYLQGGASQVS